MQMCVPFTEATGTGVTAILKLVNKKSFDGLSTGQRFDRNETIQLVTIFAELIAAELQMEVVALTPVGEGGSTSTTYDSASKENV
eukprot:1674690-Prymnesium_polylepis.2